MKKLFLGFLLMIFTISTAMAIPTGFPTKEVYNGITENKASAASNASSISTNASSISTLNTKNNLTEVTYNLEVDSTLAAAAEVEFSDIPANAVIVNSFYEVITQVESANDNTIALACGSADILTAADLTNAVAGTIAAGDIIATASTYVTSGSTACTPTVTIGAGASGVTAGQVLFHVWYMERNI